MVLSTGALTVALATATGTTSHADTGMLPNGAVITWPRFFINESGGDLIEPSDPALRRSYLNLAHCTCAQEGKGAETSFQYEVKLSTSTGTRRPGEVWVGTQCDSELLRATTCRQITDQSIPDIDALAIASTRIDLSLYDVINGPKNTDACQEREGDAYVWILVDSNGDNVYDYTTNKSVGATTDVKGIDTQPPPLPTDITATAGEASVKMSWTIPTGRAADIYGYQALCSLDGAPVRTDGTADSPQYETTTSLCDAPQKFTLTASTVAATDAGDPVEAQPGEFDQLDNAFLCGTEASGTATSLTVTGLENGKQYKVALLVYDLYGNVTGTYFSSTVAPKPVTDLWEDLHDRGSEVQGGCLGTTLPGDSGPMGGLMGGMALAGLVGGALLWRRRRQVAIVAAIVTAAGVAQADKFQPYWDEPIPDDGTLKNVEDNVHWHMGIRVGPYTPDIDGQAGVNATTGLGPYAAMFGDAYTTADGKPNQHHVWQILPTLDVDRVLWNGFGQVTIGGSIGYMKKTALAYAQGTSADDPKRLRQPGNENTFRLLPLSLEAGYRFTYLDDRFGIPVVPYFRGGLAYYAWLIKSPGGNLSRVCADGTHGCETDSNANAAKGASLGLVGSIGLAVRAEDIDRDSARSMRETGLQHAGFYAELSLAKVDGFGSAQKLSLGDTTWFAGIDFEF